jgi:hypothetical protein
MDVGALITLGTSVLTDRRKIVVINRDRLAPYEGTDRDERPEGMSSGSGWRVISAETKPRRRKARPITDITTTDLGK